MATNIEWAGETWNPVTGCTKISAGCKNCYAKRMSKRLGGRYGYPADDPFRVTLHPDRLKQPLKWKKPKRIFVCSMGDLFHPDVPFEFITKIYKRMTAHYFDHSLIGHTYIILTKRPERMKEYFTKHAPVPAFAYESNKQWQPNNVWFGVTIENNAVAWERVSTLFKIPAAIRLVSIEPMLSPIRLDEPYSFDTTDNPYGYLMIEKLDWVICGAETGPGARPMNTKWARSLRDQCKVAGVPFFFKKMSGGAPIPEDLMIREWPEQ